MRTADSPGKRAYVSPGSSCGTPHRVAQKFYIGLTRFVSCPRSAYAAVIGGACATDRYAALCPCEPGCRTSVINRIPAHVEDQPVTHPHLHVFTPKTSVKITS